MPARVVDPDLIADIITALNVKGAIRPFEISETISPVFDIGRLSGITPQEVVTPALANSVRIGQPDNTQHLTTATPPVAVADIDQDASASPLAAAILADSGQLSAGLHWIKATCNIDNATVERMLLEWRNAANSASLVTWEFQVNLGQPAELTFVGDFALNERMRWSPVTNTSGQVSTGVIFPATALQVAT